MGKTLHIIPSGNIWPRIVGKWIGERPDYDEVFVWHAEDADSQFEDVKVYTDSDVDIDSITRDSFEPGAVTQKTRKEFYEIWKSWGGEDALGSPVLVNQFESRSLRKTFIIKESASQKRC